MNLIAKMTDTSPVARAVRQEALQAMVLLLSPIAPHVCHALWQALKPGADVMREPWPKTDEAALVQEEIEFVLQVNGKLRGHMRAPKPPDPQHLDHLALPHDPGP